MEADNIGNSKEGKVSLIQIKIIEEPPYILDIYGSNIDLTKTRFNEVMKSEKIETVCYITSVVFILTYIFKEIHYDCTKLNIMFSYSFIKS